MIFITIIIIALQWTVTYANDKCDKRVIDSITGEKIVDYDNFCKQKPCVNKYCPGPNTYLFLGDNNDSTCMTKNEVIKKIGEPFNFPKEDEVYQSDYLNGLKLSTKKFKTDFTLVTYSDFTKNSKECTVDWLRRYTAYTRLLENGSVLLEIPNSSPQYNIVQQDYIVEYIIYRAKNKKWVGYLAAKIFQDQTYDGIQIGIGIGFVISSFFQIILFVIYCMFRQLRNLAGLILMAYVASFTVGIIMEAVKKFGLMQPPTLTARDCLYISIIGYFCVLSSFLWMNVMSFDIWWTFRGSAKARPINRHGIMHKFTMYCLYAFGIPFLMTVGAVIIDTLPLQHYNLAIDIKKPFFDRCMSSGENNMLYTYVPVMIIVSANIILFMMTSFNIWRLKKDNDRITKCSDSSTNQRNRNRFFLYIRLSLITGVHWVLDVIDTLVDDNMPTWLRYITNMYSALIGVFIFAIFICRKNILYMICIRFNIFRKFSESLYPKRSVKSTDASNRSGSYKRVDTDSVAIEPRPSIAD